MFELMQEMDSYYALIAETSLEVNPGDLDECGCEDCKD
jgi:hypothetical protein